MNRPLLIAMVIMAFLFCGAVGHEPTSLMKKAQVIGSTANDYFASTAADSMPAGDYIHCLDLVAACDARTASYSMAERISNDASYTVDNRVHGLPIGNCADIGSNDHDARTIWPLGPSSELRSVYSGGSVDCTASMVRKPKINLV